MDDTRAAGQGAGCDNCTQQAESGTIIADFIPLTPLLLRYVQPGYTLSAEPRQREPAGVALGSLELDDVIPFLRRLQWRVADVCPTFISPISLI